MDYLTVFYSSQLTQYFLEPSKLYHRKEVVRLDPAWIICVVYGIFSNRDPSSSLNPAEKLRASLIIYIMLEIIWTILTNPLKGGFFVPDTMLFYSYYIIMYVYECIWKARVLYDFLLIVYILLLCLYS